jgi:hypothetical protein
MSQNLKAFLLSMGGLFAVAGAALLALWRCSARRLKTTDSPQPPGRAPGNARALSLP